jgi:hypothetical protein
MISQIRKWERQWGLERRFKITFEFISETLPLNATVLDLGTPNALSEYLKEKGYQVANTTGEDLDINPESLSNFNTDAVTAFEILEHLVNPFGVLKNITSNKIYITVPLRLWFSSAYRNKSNPWDQHYHEFEDWQLDFLMDRAGWKVTRRKKWVSPSFIPGIRPFLRLFTYRYYAIEAIRK